MKDETRYMGVGVVTLTEILLVQVRHLSPHSKIDRPDPGSDGKKKKEVHQHKHRLLLWFYYLHFHRMMYRKRWPLTSWGKDIKSEEHLGSPRDYLTPPANTCGCALWFTVITDCVSSVKFPCTEICPRLLI